MDHFQYKIVGTNHVSHESLVKIEKTIETFKPDVICVELDRNRLEGLLSQKEQKMSIRMIKDIGLWGFVFAAIGRSVQKSLGKKLQITPGADMLGAVKLASEKKLKCYLIDQDVRITLRNLSKRFSWKDKWNLFKDILKAVFMPKKAMKEALKIDVGTVPTDEIVEKMLEYVKKKYPGIYSALIEERNVFMVERIISIFKKGPSLRIMVVVGAGHKKGMIKLLDQKLLKLEYIGG
jgi:pheromone shutdown protein TraB